MRARCDWTSESRDRPAPRSPLASIICGVVHVAQGEPVPRPVQPTPVALDPLGSLVGELVDGFDPGRSVFRVEPGPDNVLDQPVHPGQVGSPAWTVGRPASRSASGHDQTEPFETLEDVVDGIFESGSASVGEIARSNSRSQGSGTLSGGRTRRTRRSTLLGRERVAVSVPAAGRCGSPRARSAARRVFAAAVFHHRDPVALEDFGELAVRDLRASRGGTRPRPPGPGHDRPAGGRSPGPPSTRRPGANRRSGGSRGARPGRLAAPGRPGAGSGCGAGLRARRGSSPGRGCGRPSGKARSRGWAEQPGVVQVVDDQQGRRAGLERPLDLGQGDVGLLRAPRR